jgi:DNA-binding response OmpR family regulator
MSATMSAAEPKRIFVVDDEACAREMAVDYLAMQGFAATGLDGGASLRAAFSAAPPDLVLLDLNMAEEDGLSILRFIKQVSRVPVVLVTATVSAVDRVVGLEMGADDYVTKPIELRELLARVRAVLRRSATSVTRGEDRRLAAIACFDQVGFSLALQRDETAALARIEQVFATLVEPGVAVHRGQVFKKLGDGALLEFPSALDALEWGISFQTALFNLPLMYGARPSFRVGIVIGDIVAVGADRLGETIALATRVQEAGRPGSVTLSEFAHGIAGGRVDATFVDRGPVALKNIAQPMRLFEWTPGGTAHSG